MDPKPIVAVVEDDVDLRSAMCLALRSEYDVRSFANGRDAIEALASCAPALVLVDLNMPEMDGAAVCRALASRAGETPPVLLVSGLTGENGTLPALPGVVGALRKPFGLPQLLEKVRAHVAGGPQAAREARRAAAPLSGPRRAFAPRS